MLKRKTIDKRFVDYVFLAGLPADFRINPKEQESTDQLSSLEVKETKEDSSERNDATEQYNVAEDKVQIQKAKEDDATIKIVTKDIDTTSLNTTTSTYESTSLLSNITLPTAATSTTSTSDISDNNVSETFNMPVNRSSTDFLVNDEENKRLFDSLFEGIKIKILKFDQERDEFLGSMGKDLADKLNIGDFNNSNDGDDENKRKSATSKKSFKDIDEGFLETDSILSLSSNSTLKQEESTDNRASYQNVVPQQPSSKQSDINPDALLHPLKQKFSPKLLSRYPKNDYPKEGAFPAYIPMFCFPNDIMIRESDTCPTTTFHGFVMTQEDGSQRYGVCLTTFEPIPDDLFEELNEQQKIWRTANMTPSEVEYAENLNEKVRAERRRMETARAKIVLQGKDISSKEFEEIEKEKTDAKEKLALYNEVLQPIKLGVLDKSNLWVPKCIGIISHLPWHDVLKDWLCAVVMPMVEGLKENDPTQSLIPLERYIVNLIHEIPLPPPGRLQVAMSVNNMTFFCTRPALNQIPIMKDFSLYPLFRSLSIKNIITLFEVALSEGKILLISSYPDMLYLVAHSITYLIYPFYWQGVFIPVLPARLMTCLQAPVPYIMGIERQYKGIDLLPEDACIVDIDKDTILMAEPPIQIPSRQRKKLIQSLEAHSPLHTRYNVPLGVPVFIQQAYPNGRFTPMSNKSKIYDKTRGDKIGSVVGMPSRAIPLTPLMTGSFDPENGLMKFNNDDDSRIDQALQLVPICNNESRSNNSNRSSSSSIGDIIYNSRNIVTATTHNKHVRSGVSTGNFNVPDNRSSSSSIGDIFYNSRNVVTTATGITTTHNKHVRSGVSTGNLNVPDIAIQRRFSNFVSPSNGFSDTRSERSRDKFGKKTKQRFSSITGGARNSIMTLKNKALTRNGVFSHSRLGSINTTSNNNSVISTPTSPEQTKFSGSLFDDASSTICRSPDKLPLGAISEKDCIPKEGHLMVLLSPDHGQKSGINTWKMEGLACGICRNSLGINPVYKCEGCSMMIHDECLADVVYPCVPACFDETKIAEAFLRVFASLLWNYRSYLNNDNTTSDIRDDGFDDAGELFKKDLFLKNFDKDAKGFLSNLVDSQSFSQFISERVIRKSEDYEIRYFDEVIKAKLNRSKLRLSKESTTFLDGSFDVSETVRAMKPNEEDLDELGFEGYVCLPDCFDPELMSTPRPVRDGWANGFGKGWR